MIGNIRSTSSYQQTGTQQKYGVYSSNSTGEILQSDKQSKLEMRHEIYERTKEKSKSDQLLQSIKVQSVSLQNSRTKVKNTSMQMKKLRYRYKNISARIISSKTSFMARQAASQAHREVLSLSRAKKSGAYDSDEMEAAIVHAKAMERIAKKKVRHLEEEELAKSSGESCTVSQEEDEMRDEAQNEASMENLSENDALEEETEAMMSDFLLELSDGLNELMDELPFDELIETVSYEDMSAEDLDELKRKHRNKEMQEIVKADAQYLKSVFEHLEREKTAGVTMNFGGEAMPDTGMNPASQSVIDVAL